MKTLRETVSECMVRIHGISPELAEYHVRQMMPSEVKRRFLMYIGISGSELSAAGPRRRAVNVSSTRLFTPATMTAGRAALNPVPREKGGMTANT